MPHQAPDSPEHWRPLLEQGAWFAQVSPTLRETWLASAVVRRLEAGQPLFLRGDPPCGLYAVLEGAVQISGVGGGTGDSREVLLTLLEPPHWFGEVALFDGQPRTHDAHAGPVTRLLHIPQAKVLAGLSAQPGHWRELGLLMAQKLRLVFVELEEAAILPVGQRLARRLVQMAGGYGVRGEGGAGMHRRSIVVSQEQLARMLSVTRQTVNQNLKGLEAQRVLRLTRGGVEIMDWAGLQALAGPVG